MSIPVQRMISCPKCGKKISFTMWQSINTSIPTAREDIISGKLFEMECEHCGQKTRITYPILFNDMNHNVMIYLVQPSQLDSVLGAAEKITRFGSRARVVTSVDELREKAMIFGADLDDRVVEVLKLLATAQVKRQLTGKHIQAMFFSDNDNLRFEMIVDGQTGYVKFNMDDYEMLLEEMHLSFETLKNEFCINREWANEYISSLEGDYI